MKTNRCTRTIPTLTMAAALLIGAQTEVQAAASGSVTATVQINIAPAPVACITLNKTALSFNPVTALSPSNAGQINAATVIVTNCGGAAHLSLSTTNMTGVVSSVTSPPRRCSMAWPTNVARGVL